MRSYVELLRLEAVCRRASPHLPNGAIRVLVQLPENAREEAISPVDVTSSWMTVHGPVPTIHIQA